MLSKKDEKSFTDLREKPYEGKCDVAMPSPTVSAAPPPPKGPTVYLRGVKLDLTAEDVMVIKTGEVQFRLRNIESGVNYDNKRRNTYEIELIGLKIK